MACYTAVAHFCEGPEKKQLIELLQGYDKGQAASQVMRKLLGAIEKDAFRVPREIAEDLLAGMTPDEVENKPYKYVLEMFFYTQPDFIPKNDPHWRQITFAMTGKITTKSVEEVVEIREQRGEHEQQSVGITNS